MKILSTCQTGVLARPVRDGRQHVGEHLEDGRQHGNRQQHKAIPQARGAAEDPDQPIVQPDRAS